MKKGTATAKNDDPESASATTEVDRWQGLGINPFEGKVESDNGEGGRSPADDLALRSFR